MLTCHLSIYEPFVWGVDGAVMLLLCGWLTHSCASVSSINMYSANQHSERRRSRVPAQLMHSQMKDNAPVGGLDAEPLMQRLLVATRGAVSGEPAVTVHSLSPEEAFLAEKVAYSLRPARPPGAPAFQRASQVGDLQGLKVTDSRFVFKTKSRSQRTACGHYTTRLQLLQDCPHCEAGRHLPGTSLQLDACHRRSRGGAQGKDKEDQLDGVLCHRQSRGGVHGKERKFIIRSVVRGSVPLSNEHMSEPRSCSPTPCRSSRFTAGAGR